MRAYSAAVVVVWAGLYAWLGWTLTQPAPPVGSGRLAPEWAPLLATILWVPVSVLTGFAVANRAYRREHARLVAESRAWTPPADND